MTGLEIVILALLALVTIVVAVNMGAGPFLASEGAPSAKPLVSVLIPARDEEHVLPSCLAALKNQTYANIEIIVCDDHSTDGTEAAVLAAQREDARLRLVKGRPLPEHWTGKNWACAQLARASRGEILLFLDADVVPGPHSVEQTVAALERTGADALSAFPEQRLTTPEAKAIIPMMDVLLYCFLPLQLVFRTRFPSLVAANGQWMAFTRPVYEAIGTHEAVRAEVVEDMALARRVKELGKTFFLCSGADTVVCRMYTTLGEIVEGFSKNFYAGFGQRTILFVGILALFVLLFVIPPAGIVFSQAPFFLLGTLLNLIFRSMLSWRLHHGALSVVLHPVGALAAVIIGLNGVRLAKLQGSVRWKGREISVGARPHDRTQGGPHHGC
jgi:chlorobactene glucosyltransferase